MDSNVINAFSTGLAALAAFAAVIVSWVVYKGQSAMSEKISKEQTALSLRIHENQMLLSQRQLLIPLWSYMSTLSHIDSDSPVEPDALKVVNTLELVAISCEGGMVDTKVIKRTFRDLYMQFYEEVQAIKMLPGRGISGPALLNENRAAMKFYKELQEEHINRDSLSRV